MKSNETENSQGVEVLWKIPKCLAPYAFKNSWNLRPKQKALN